MRHTILLMVAAMGIGTSAAQANQGDPRPDPGVLRFDDQALLARFTTEVRDSPVLSGRALSLWRTLFAAKAEVIAVRFLTEEDWRPAFADAAYLVDDFLELTQLPRAGYWRKDRQHVWIEVLHPETGKRARVLQKVPYRPVFLAPTRGNEQGKKPSKPAPKRVPIDD